MITKKKLCNEKIIIQCNAHPNYYFFNSKPFFHNVSKGVLETNTASIKLFYFKNKVITKEHLLFSTNSKRFLNSNVLDFFFNNPDYIPNLWSDKRSNSSQCVIFGGTLYLFEGKDLCVPVLELWGNKIEINEYEVSSLDDNIPFAIV